MKLCTVVDRDIAHVRNIAHPPDFNLETFTLATSPMGDVASVNFTNVK